MIYIRLYFRPEMYVVVKVPRTLVGTVGAQKADLTKGNDYQYGDWYLLCARPDGSRYRVHVSIGCDEGDFEILEGFSHGAQAEGR